MTEDDDLRLLLHSPALSLEPPARLADAVRAGARRRRMRTTVGGTLAAVAVVCVGILLGPGVKDSVDGLLTRSEQSAGGRVDPRAPAATSDVVTLQTINAAEVLTWFEGSAWCTRTTRLTRQQTCLGPVDAEHRGFSWVLPARSPSLTVDDQHLVAGVVPPDATRVIVHMKDGREYGGEIHDSRGFVRPVWSVLVDDSSQPVEYYAALDSAGREIGRKPA